MTDQAKDNSEIIATLLPALVRLWAALITITGFACLLLWVAATGATGTLVGTVLLLTLSALSFYAAHRIYKIQNISLYLTHQGLFDTSGNTLCRIEDIESLDRSFFALKPSNGFVIKLKSTADRAWLPGLWWRFGKRIGVGGVTSVSQAKSMADTISLLLKDGAELLEDDQRPFAR